MVGEKKRKKPRFTTKVSKCSHLSAVKTRRSKKIDSIAKLVPSFIAFCWLIDPLFTTNVILPSYKKVAFTPFADDLSAPSFWIGAKNASFLPLDQPPTYKTIVGWPFSLGQLPFFAKQDWKWIFDGHFLSLWEKCAMRMTYDFSILGSFFGPVFSLLPLLKIP